MTNLEKKYAKMTPAERKKTAAEISAQMGMMPKKNAPKKTAAKKTTKKK